MLHDEEGNDTTAHEALQDVLPGVMEGVGSPSGISAIANLRTDLRIGVKPASIENCGGNPADLRLV